MNNKSTIITRSPLRVGLAGGGTDIKSYYTKYSGSVINFAIRKYHYIKLTPSKNKYFEYSNQNNSKSYKFLFDEIKHDKKDDFCLISSSILYFVQKYSLPVHYFDISIYSDAPRGSGLGASSSLVVGILSCLSKFYGIDLNNIDIAEQAYEIERELLELDGGFQDQYVASFGGLNFIEFTQNDEVIVCPLLLDSDTKFHFESHFISFFTGISRDSESIIKDQRNSISEEKKMSLMNDLKLNSVEMKNAILLKNFSKIPEILNNGFKIKKKISNKVSNRFLDNIINEIFEEGVMGCKISGAGGGGYITCYIKPENRGGLINYLNKNKFDYFDCLIHEEGIQSYIDK